MAEIYVVIGLIWILKSANKLIVLSFVLKKNKKSNTTYKGNMR